jgi:penicillin-binding protein-related factor A (putative recombinase)
LSSRNEGNIFEDAFESSCKKQKVFFSRNRDVFIPPKYRTEIRVPKNLYDYFMFADKTLFPLELKSTKENNLPFKNIKDHQLEALEKASEFENVISGILINFRHDTNKVYFINIIDFLQYQKVAKGEAENTYKSKVNRSSIPVGICCEIGIEVGSKLLKVNYSYHVKELVSEAIKKYGE